MKAFGADVADALLVDVASKVECAKCSSFVSGLVGRCGRRVSGLEGPLWQIRGRCDHW